MILAKSWNELVQIFKSFSSTDLTISIIYKSPEHWEICFVKWSEELEIDGTKIYILDRNEDRSNPFDGMSGISQDDLIPTSFDGLKILPFKHITRILSEET